MKSKYTATKLACYIGYIIEAAINSFLPILFIALQDVYGLGYEKLARLMVFNFVAQMVADIISPKIVAALGYRKTAIFCQGMAAIGLVMLYALPRLMNNTYLAIIISICIYAFASGMMEVTMSPIIERLPTRNKFGNMSILHSFYCWGQAIAVVATTLLLTIFGYKGWANIPLIGAIIPFLNMFSFLKVPIIEPEKDIKKAPYGALIKSKSFRIYMLMMICAGACEIAMAEWASIFAQQALGVSKVIGDIAGPCAFAIFMGAGRIWYALVSHKVSFKKTLVFMSIGCLMCYIAVAVCNNPVFSLVFCALCGFTVSISWPGIYSAGANDFPKGNSVMYSIFAMCGDTGCCLGPWVLGIVADGFNLKIGFAVTAVFPLIMIFATLAQIKNKDCKYI